MFSAHVLVCSALVLSASLHNAAAEYCISDSYGVLAGVKIELKQVFVRPYVQQASISVPVLCGSAENQQGLVVTVCDDAPPSVRAVSTTLATASRSGSLAGNAVVYTTVYCHTNSQQYLGASAGAAPTIIE